jgi:two-component SAPR family response regulator
MLLIEGRIHLLTKQPDRAITAFKECRDYFQQDGREMEVLWGLIWLIAALGEAGEIESARTQALEFISHRKASSHPMLIAIGQAAPWLKLLRNDPELGRSLNSLLEKARRLLEKMPAVRRSLRHLAQSIEMPAAGLVIHALGRGEVQVDGRVVSSSDWKNQSVRDLFFYFLCKGIAVTKEQIAADLWPDDEDPQILKQRFKTYIFRLRRATRRDVIIFDEEYYRFNYALDYEYDVETFETFLARARAAREPQERIEHYRRAEQLVKGPYLADLNMPWALGERERLEEAFLAALTDLAQLYLSGGQLQEAASTAHRILEQDPYREEIHQLSMKTYSALKDRRAIHRQYEACKSALAVLGLLPSPQTERLYHELTG